MVMVLGEEEEAVHPVTVLLVEVVMEQAVVY